MASWLGVDAKPIVEGWPGPPQLSAPNIGELVRSILQNKLAREKMTGENIADTIKNVRQERQSNAYLDAMKAAGLISQDYEAGGVGGATLGEKIAKLKLEQEQQGYMGDYYRAHTGLFGAQEEKERTIADYIKQYGTTPGRGTSTAPHYDENGVERAVGETWIGSDGKERIMTQSQGPKLTAAWSQPTDVRGLSQGETYRTENELLKQKENLDLSRKIQEQEDVKAKRANIPFRGEDEYQRLLREIEAVRQKRGQPQTTPQAGVTPPADQNLAPGYGAPPAPPKAGDVIKGYRFIGGDPRDRNNWEKVE